MMQAIMIKDEYSDIALDYPYEIARVYADGHIRLKNSPRIYDGRNFRIERNGRKISLRKAYDLYEIEKVKEKLGIKR